MRPRWHVAALAILLVGWGCLSSPPLVHATGPTTQDCTEPVYGACGGSAPGGSCAKDTKVQTTTCNGNLVFLGCSAHNESCCDYTAWAPTGTCYSPGYEKLVRTATAPGCTNTVYYQSNTTLCPVCDYTAWTPTGICCSGGYEYQTRTATVSNCNALSQCYGNATLCPVPLQQPTASWGAYGYAVPGDPEYGFSLPSNSTKDLVGLAAKGNIVIGDYTSYADDPLSPTDFSTAVLPKLKPKSDDNPAGITMPYVVDPTDADMGYDSLDPSLCGGKSPCFNGDYTVQDKQDGLPAFKADSVTPRKFYETSLPDTQMKALADPALRNQFYTSPIKIDAILYTNHAVAALVKAPHLVLNGAVVARDDALLFNKSMTVNHDVRLISDQASKAIALPLSLARPSLTGRTECQAETCTPD